MTDDHATGTSPPEEIVRLSDPDSGLDGAIVLHSTRLGPAAGGCRLWPYPDLTGALTDALRLAEGMTAKNALAGLPLGGGKAVIRRPAGDHDRAALFRAFGRAVAQLDGRYVTAEDVGTSIADMEQVASVTRHVAGLAKHAGRAGGDPSPWTARGVFAAMRVAVRHRLGGELSDVTVGVQGVGSVGFALCALLHAAGARLIVTDPNRDAVARAVTQFGATAVSGEALLRSEVEVLAPCALGGTLDAATVRHLRASVVCGAANNQLATPAQAGRLADRDILYAPDYLVNAGGVINVAAEHLGWDESEVDGRVAAIGDRLGEVLADAAQRGETPVAAAARRVATILAGARRPALMA